MIDPILEDIAEEAIKIAGNAQHLIAHLKADRDALDALCKRYADTPVPLDIEDGKREAIRVYRGLLLQLNNAIAALDDEPHHSVDPIAAPSHGNPEKSTTSAPVRTR
jgi:hypothetical protein